MLLRSLIILILVAITTTGFSQSRKSKKKNKSTRAAQTQTDQPNALNPVMNKDYAPKASKKASKGATYESEREYYERKETLAKARRKNEKLLEKPQYSDPTYFGHKRPPKRHKAGKLKFCKECGIRH